MFVLLVFLASLPPTPFSPIDIGEDSATDDKSSQSYKPWQPSINISHLYFVHLMNAVGI